MQQVFTDQNIAVVGSVKSYLESHGLSCQLRNEFSSSVMGEVAFFDVWPEVCNPGSFEICWQCGQTQNDQAPLA